MCFIKWYIVWNERWKLLFNIQYRASDMKHQVSISIGDKFFKVIVSVVDKIFRRVVMAHG